MIAGRLTETIMIEHTERRSDSPTGFMLPEDVKRVTTRADVKWGGGGRSNENGEIVYPYDITFICWLYVEKFCDEYDTIRYRGESYAIISIEPDRPGKRLYIKCRKNV